METGDGRPTPTEAAEALAAIEQTQATLHRTPSPKWYPPSLAAMVGGLMLAQLLPGIAAPLAAIALAAGTGALIGRRIDRTGIRPRITEDRRKVTWLITGVWAALLITVGVLAHFAGLWWLWLVAAPVAAIGALLAGRRLW
ncbi:hypothetical protein F0L68_22725 [Solihabitans fulvus]|uniref:Uncharacterized protein n=1 Tax=Solihabitans fulvus TaxID=1892852 RepID=A0A5B2X5N3_9PSEU|nr:hypothetical protein [Solihabitans fulvus]KAA2258657.1 hypothetical protein F0L68_22725 [Solihabitans fulvus]